MPVTNTSFQVTISGQTLNIHNGQYTSDVVQLARDALQGFRGDYYFFQNTVSEYVLITASSMDYSGGLLSADSYDALVFVYDDQLDSISVSESGSVNGNAWGTPGGMQYNGSYSGSLYMPVTDRTYYQWFYTSDQPLTIYNSNHYVVYGSFEGLPHLREGSENYAFAEIFLLLCFFAFFLVDRIFKHIGN